MANGLSLKVLLQLRKEQFDKGMSEVKSSITGLGRTIKSVAGMIVGGLGLGALVNQFKETATQMSIVKNTLENVSDGFDEYSENMQFIQRIAKDYGQDMIALANGFAKFHAAAKQTNLSLDQQRFIYEALTKAAGAFHLSADQTSNVMLAVEQMISKGKVAAEELRRQLGNSLPGAFNYMAEAAGAAGLTLNGTTAELEAAMKAGKVMSEQVLPEFAKVLNRVTQTADFDSLQSSLNRFRNAWATFVDESGFENVFKTLVDMGTNALDYLGQKSISIGRMFMTGLGAVIGSQLPKAWAKFKAEGEKLVPPFEKISNGINEGLRETQKQLDYIDRELARVHKAADGESVFSIIKQDDLKYMDNLSKTQDKLLKQLTAQGHETVFLETKEEALNRLRAKGLDLEMEKVKLLNEQSVLQSRMLQMNKNAVWAGLQKTLGAVWNTIKGIAVSMAAAFAVGLLIDFIGKMVELISEANKLKNLARDAQKEVEKATEEVNGQIAKMDVLLRTVNDVNNSEEHRKRSLKEINQLLGSEALSMEDIRDKADLVTASIAAWKQGLISAARASAYTAKLIELETKKIDLESQITIEKAKPQTYQGMSNREDTPWNVGNLGKLTRDLAQVNNQIEILEKNMQSDASSQFSDSMKTANTVMNKYGIELYKLEEKKKKGIITQKQFEDEEKKISGIARNAITNLHDWSEVVKNFSANYQKLWKNIQKYGAEEGNSGAGAGSGKIKSLAEMLDDFSAEKKKFDNLLKNGIISEDEYEDEIEKLINKYREDIYALDELEKKLGSLGQKHRQVFDYINDEFQNITLKNAMEESMKQLDEAIKENEKVLDKEFDKLLDKVEKYNEKSGELLSSGVPQKKQKENGFFAYKDGLHESLGRYAKDAEDYAKELENIKNKILELKKYGDLDPALQKMLDEVIEKLRIAKNEAKGLRDAANFAELSEDIKKLKEELNSDVWEVWTEGLVGATGRIVSALEKINDVFEGEMFDEEFFEGFNKILTVIDALNDIVGTVSDTFKTFNTVIETNKKLQEAQAAMTTLTSGAKVKALAAETVAEATSQSATISAEAAKTSAINATTTALAAQAVAGAASSQASIPIVGPILAAAAVAGIVALLAANMKRFSTGGIVGGNSTQGDNQAVRVNSSEMILNKHQQANLWSILKNGGTGGGGVDFRIRGCDLVGVLRNYDSRLKG